MQANEYGSPGMDGLEASAQELRQCSLGEILFQMSKVDMMRKACLSLALRWEGAAFFSRTARRIMRSRYGVSIGAYSYGGCFEPGAFPGGGVAIGRYVSVASGVKFFRRNRVMTWLSLHPAFFNPALGFQREDKAVSTPLRIEHDAWIGERAMITPGCRRVGLGSIIGAGAVVTKDVPDFAVVAGNPARTIRLRFSENICEAIGASEWWRLPIERLADKMQRMTSPVEDGQWLRSEFGRSSQGKMSE